MGDYSACQRIAAGWHECSEKHIGSSKALPTKVRQLPDAKAVRRDLLRRLKRHRNPRDYGFDFPPTRLVQDLVGPLYCEEGGVKRLYFLVDTTTYSPRFNGCHTCKAAVSVFTYRGSGGGWSLEQADYRVGFYGNWGFGPEAENVSTVRIAPKRCGIAFTTFYSSHGGGIERYVLLGRIAGHVRELFSTYTIMSNGMVEEPYAIRWRTQIRFIHGPNGYYDIQLHRHGVSEGRRIDYRVRYRFDGQRYRPLGPDPLKE
jgi:hypothetical protein